MPTPSAAVRGSEVRDGAAGAVGDHSVGDSRPEVGRRRRGFRTRGLRENTGATGTDGGTKGGGSTLPEGAGSHSEAAVLSLRGVSRSYGEGLALAPLTVTLGAGSITGLAGHNGSGKTTLLRIAAGLMRPSTGSRSVSGSALYLRPGDGARRAQTVRQALAFVARACRGTESAHDVVEAAIEATALRAHADQAAGRLSSGEAARLTLAVALVWRADLVCLDEPTAHSDEAGAALAADVVRVLASGGAAVMVATHDPSFLAGAADAWVHLEAGRVRQVTTTTPTRTGATVAPARVPGCGVSDQDGGSGYLVPGARSDAKTSAIGGDGR